MIAKVGASTIQPAVESEIPRDVPTVLAVPTPTATESASGGLSAHRCILPLPALFAKSRLL